MQEKGHWPGQILQVSGQLALLINVYLGNYSVVIGSNPDYVAIHKLGGQASKNQSVTIPTRPYLKLPDGEFKDILYKSIKYLKKNL